MSVCRNHNPYDRWTYDHQCPVCLSKTIDEKDATIAELNARVKELEENLRESRNMTDLLANALLGDWDGDNAIRRYAEDLCEIDRTEVIRKWESQKQDQSTLSESNERLREHITSLNCGGRDGIDVCTEDSACFVHSALSDTPSGQRLVKREVLEPFVHVPDNLKNDDIIRFEVSGAQMLAAQAELDRTR